MTTEELLDLVITNRLMGLHTSMPGVVESYDAGEQRADIKPQLQRPMPDGEGGYTLEDLPVLPGVRMCHPRGGGYFASFPMQKGDKVLLVFAERPIGNWLQKGQPCSPGDLRTHTLAGAQAIPCNLYPSSEKLQDASADSMVIGKDGTAGSQIKITADGIQLGSGADDQVLTKKDFLAFLKAWADATPGTTDGGALMRSNTLATMLTTYGLTPAAQSGFGSPYVKAKR